MGERFGVVLAGASGEEERLVRGRVCIAHRGINAVAAAWVDIETGLDARRMSGWNEQQVDVRSQVDICLLSGELLERGAGV